MTGLEAVRRHHLAAAHVRADAILRDARAQAQQIAAKSDADARALIEQAEKEGEEAAELDTSLEWTSARRRARGVILAAQNEAYQDLRAAVTAAVSCDSRYPSLLGCLADAARRKLGPGAEVAVDAGGDRGVTATRKDRRVDWSLEKIVDESVYRLGPSIEELWR
jgi:vacuolar-type H+-ATPase subunit E/Vma4